MMTIEQKLAAVERLPEVGTVILRDCAGIRRLIARAQELDHAAAHVREQADQLMGVLHSRLVKNWTPEELRRAGLEV